MACENEFESLGATLLILNFYGHLISYGDLACKIVFKMNFLLGFMGQIEKISESYSVFS